MKTPQYTKRADGRYQTRIYLGIGEDKKKQYKYLYADTPKELKALEDELRLKLNKGIDILSMQDSYKQWAERLEAVRKIDMISSEYKTFKSRVDFFSAYFGEVRLKDISQTTIQPVINGLFKQNPATSKPTAKRTLERYLAALSKVFEYAIENRVIDFNPCKYVRIPKDAVKNERRALSTEEREWVENTPHAAQRAAMLLMYSGLRRGEATALLWTDIDFQNNTITVNKSFDFKTNKIKKPKTQSGIRTVTVPKKLVDFLRNEKRASVLVLTQSNGAMLTNKTWETIWEKYIFHLNKLYGKQILEISNENQNNNIITIQPFTPHCLRHTFCTIMYEAGVDVLSAKEQMGHKDIKTTLAIYTHLDKIHKKNNMTKLDEYLSQNNAENSAGVSTGVSNQA